MESGDEFNQDLVIKEKYIRMSSSSGSSLAETNPNNRGEGNFVSQQQQRIYEYQQMPKMSEFSPINRRLQE